MEQQLRKLIQLKPDYAQAYNALGYSLADRNIRLPEASSLLEKALELSPDDYFILDSMGWLQYRLGKLDQALDFLRRAYADKPDPEIAAHLGEVLWMNGQLEEAGKIWQRGLQLQGDHPILLDTIKRLKPNAL
jgi:Flp pilus assembly protein TadD